MSTCDCCCPLMNFLGCNVTKKCSYTFKFVFIDEADNYEITITPDDGRLYEIKYVKEVNESLQTKLNEYRNQINELEETDSKLTKKINGMECKIEKMTKEHETYQANTNEIINKVLSESQPAVC